MAERILLVEDDRALREVTEMHLQGAGYTVEAVGDGNLALEAAAAARPDAVVLDLMLPGRSGLEVCRELRARYAPSPGVVMVTAKGSEADMVIGLDAGADDYVVKPFSPRELVARVRAHLRRRTQATQARWQCIDAFELDRQGLRIRYRGQLLDLTRYEYGLLEALLARPGAVFSRGQLMDRVWADALDSSDRTVDTHIKTLRAKLEAVRGNAAGDPIRTHRGLGYSLDVGG